MENPDVASPMGEDAPDLPQGGPAVPADPASSGYCCPECASRGRPAPALIYAIGSVEARFPTIGIEREFQQRQGRLPEAAAEASRASQVRRVLEANPHVAVRMSYVFLAAGVPAFILAPTGRYLQDELLTAVEHTGDPDYWCVLIGRRGPMAGPEVAGGVLAPIVACDQLYCFSQEEWKASLAEQLAPAIKAERINRRNLNRVTKELFAQILNSTENIGATDAHRALNYVLVQHPGLFLAAAERAGKQVLERIEARQVHGLGARRIVAVIVTFLDMATGVPERLFTRVDVTEEWPFHRRPSGRLAKAAGPASLC